MYHLILALATIIGVQGDTLESARKATIAGDYAKSAAILDKIKPTPETYNDYYYYRLLNHFKLNDKTKALEDLKNLENSFNFNKLARRQDSLVFLMSEDLKNWKEGDLGDIERDMKKSADRLQIAQGGKETQKIQKDIVDKLDKLIKDQENKGKGGDGQGDKDAQAKQQKQGPGGQGQPAPDSIVMGGQGKGKLDEKELKKIAESWGTMPPAQRAKVVQEITRDLPEKYRPMIEEYFKALNRVHGVKP